MTVRFKKINKMAALYVAAQGVKSVTVDGKSYVAERLPNNEFKVTRYGVMAWLTFNYDKGILQEQGNKQVLDVAKQDLYKFPRTNEKNKNVTIDDRNYVASNLGDGNYRVSRIGPIGYVEFNSNSEFLAEVGEPKTISEIKTDMQKFPKNILS